MIRVSQETGRITHIGEMALEWPDHPIMPAPTAEQFADAGYESAMRMINARQAALRAEEANPYLHGWEPPMWRLADCLIEWPWMTPEEREFAARVRAKLSFTERIRVLLINGGNRAGKSEYLAKRLSKLLQWKKKAIIWPFHSTEAMSISQHHKLFWKFLPEEQRRNIKTPIEYISYTQKGGFSDNKFVLANGSECEFRNYKQGLDTLQGPGVDAAWADELCPIELYHELLGRVASKAGLVINTFTPIDGYTPLIADYREGARCVLSSDAWLLPLDAGGEVRKDRALEIEDVLARAERGPVPRTAEALKYRPVPRVEVCREPHRAVLFFHTSDNPFGKPEEIVKLYPRDLLMRFHGVAEKSYAARFAFDETAHVVKPARIPPGGTNIMIADPASGRNCVMLWVRFSREKIFVYRESPTLNRHVRGEGVLGPWAEFDGKKADGKRGPGQKSLGWGLRRYKEEIAELEGWKDYKPDECGSSKTDDWRETNGAREVVMGRYMDSRFASSPKLENDRPVTTLSQFEDIGLWFATTSGADIEDGLIEIESALYFDTKRPLDVTNEPRLYISEECPNLIHAMKTWTGADGQSGATKDFIDVLRYALMTGVGDMSGALAPRPTGATKPSARHY